MTNWNSWDTVSSMIGKDVLVKSQHSDGRISYESATIYEDEETGDILYIFFDGESYNDSVTPIGWMEIPSEVKPVESIKEKIGNEVIVKLDVGSIVHENVEVHMNDDEYNIVFLNGDYNVTYEILGWMEIPA